MIRVRLARALRIVKQAISLFAATKCYAPTDRLALLSEIPKSPQPKC